MSVMLQNVVKRLADLNARIQAVEANDRLPDFVYFGSPSPPATECDLRQVAGSFPESYLEFLKIADGWTGYFFAQDLFGTHDVLKQTAAYRSAVVCAEAFFDGNGWPWESKDLFVIAKDRDGYGNLVVPKYGENAGKYIHCQPDPEVYDSLEEYLGALIPFAEAHLREEYNRD
jgi:hypothetical protein